MRLCAKLFSKMSSCSRTFLFWFSNENSNFAIPELEALFKLFRLDPNVFASRKAEGPFVLMNFPDEDGPKKLMSRSVLMHSCYELWGYGSSLKEMHEDVKLNLDKFTPYNESRFEIRVETYGKTIKHSEKLNFIETFTYLPLQGKVDLKNPECSFHLILYFGLDANNIPVEPYQAYFGRWITDGQRRLASKTNLKERKFIGNTSMDPVLSLVMVNLAMVKENDIVLDPFVGTGSILVAAACMGASVIGIDVDYLLLHGRTRSSRAFQKDRSDGESIRANLIQYGLESKYLDVLVGDASRPLWRDEFRFDAIITDPPYGIREPTEKLGSSKIREPGFKIKEEHLAKHIPSKTDYSLTEIFCDLMNFGAQRLELGGRLVCWIPISRPDYDEEKLPRNECLSLTFNTEQVLTSFGSRRLLVFEKVKEPSASCQSVMDATAMMYRFKLTDSDPDVRKTRKAETKATLGKLTKRGQMFSPKIEPSNA